jgi:hypothetical protein
MQGWLALGFWCGRPGEIEQVFRIRVHPFCRLKLGAKGCRWSATTSCLHMWAFFGRLGFCSCELGSALEGKETITGLIHAQMPVFGEM